MKGFRFALVVFGCAAWISAGAMASGPSFQLGFAAHLFEGKPPSQRYLDLICKSGANTVRSVVPWVRIKNGRLPSYWLKASRQLLDCGVRIVANLGYGNESLGIGKPRDESSLTAYKKYVTSVANEMKPYVTLYEIWNEWDARTGGTEPGDVDSYLSLVEAAAEALGQASPETPVLGGSFTPGAVNRGMLEAAVRGGILRHVDGIGVHEYVYYRRSGSNDVRAVIDDLSRIGRSLKDEKGRTPSLYITEVGWPTYGGRGGVSEKLQGIYVARLLVLVRTLPYIKGLWWYDLADDIPSERAVESHFGVLEADLTPKPAFIAFTNLSRTIRGARSARLLSVAKGCSSTVAVSLDMGSSISLALWTQGLPERMTLARSRFLGGTGTYIDALSPARQAQAISKDKALAIDQTPKIVSGLLPGSIVNVQNGKETCAVVAS